MSFSRKFLKSIKIRKILSIIIFVSIVLILLLAYFFIENKISYNILVLILFGFAVVQILVLQFFFKNQLKNEVRIASLRNNIGVLQSELDEANRIADYKSIYLANLSYEIRTPLSTVLGMLNMLKQTHLDDDQKAQIEIAEYSSKHLLQLINIVSDNEDVDKRDIKLNLLAIDLKYDLSNLFKIFEYQAWEKGLEFEYKFLMDEKRKFSLLGDSLRIQQVLINLINNAIKFTNSGKIAIIIDQTISIEDEIIVTFYIKDTGIGFGSDEMKEIFNTSKASTISRERDYRGGGLGLPVSYKLVNLMGGDLKLESKENEGSTFYFSLQLKKTLGIKLEEVIQEPALLEKFSVLVAEDNRMNQKVIKSLLEQQGADCTFVKNGLEAVELYKILDFDMVFMDIYMPDMDGYEATKAIKKTEKYAHKKTPIVAVSASAFEADITNAKLAGIDDFLAKPIELNKLKELLVKYSKKEV